jgi:hypothetical protein
LAEEEPPAKRLPRPVNCACPAADGKDKDSKKAATTRLVRAEADRPALGRKMDNFMMLLPALLFFERRGKITY